MNEKSRRRDSTFGDVPLHPTIVIAPGIELTEDEGGEVVARPVESRVLVGQLGIYIPTGRKTSLFAGTVPGRESVRISEATNGGSCGSIDSLLASTVETPPATVGDRLRRAMYAASMSVDALNAESKVSKATIYRLLNCEDTRLRRTQIDTVIALADALEVRGWWLETGEGEPPDGNYRSSDHEG